MSAINRVIEFEDFIFVLRNEMQKAMDESTVNIETVSYWCNMIDDFLDY